MSTPSMGKATKVKTTPATAAKSATKAEKVATAERRDELHRAIQVKGIRIAIFMLGYWGALLFGANKAAELWPQYFARAPFWSQKDFWTKTFAALLSVPRRDPAWFDL